MNIAERTLPHDLGAERSILGAVLLDADALDLAADIVSPEHFFRDAHGRIFRAMLAVSAKSSAVDFTTLRSELERAGDLDEAGGPAYLSALVDGVPRSTNVEHYARIVKEKAALRGVIFTTNKALAQAYAAEVQSAEIATDTAEKLHELGGEAMGGQAYFIGDLVSGGMDAIEHAHATKGASVTGVASGFGELDDLLSGFQPTDLILIAARPSQGKTALALNIAAFMSLNIVVLFFSLEMSKEQLFLRMLSSESRVDSHRLRRGYIGDADWSRLAAAMGSIQDRKLLIDDKHGAGVREVRARARQVKAKHGLGAIVIDQISHMRGRGRFDSRREEIGSISRGVKGIAKELGVPVILLSQLSRASEAGPGKKARRPQLSDLAESASLEADADVVIFPYRPERPADEEQPADGMETAELIVAKQRNGPTGTVKVVWNKEIVRFENLEVV